MIEKDFIRLGTVKNSPGASEGAVGTEPSGEWGNLEDGGNVFEGEVGEIA